MTQKEKTLAAREAFYKALDSLPLNEGQYLSVGLAATNWATLSYGEGIDAARTETTYAVTATATHDGTATIVEPVTH